MINIKYAPVIFFSVLMGCTNSGRQNETVTPDKTTETKLVSAKPETSSPPAKRCSDEGSYDKGYTWAGNQRGLQADCDYLFDIAQASDSGPLSHYCFCRGVEAYQKQNR